MVLFQKRLEGKGFVRPAVRQGAVQLTKTQFEALFERLDWRRITAARQIRPSLVQRGRVVINEYWVEHRHNRPLAALRRRR